MTDMLIAALTGGIASGKSVASQILEELGCAIHRADQIAHELMEPEKSAWKKIVAHFGQEILNKDNTINRTQLGTIVFSDEKKRRFLNRIIHPLVFEKKRETIDILEKEGRYKIFISEAALTIEAGFADFFDKIIMVYCSEDIQIKRLMERNQISHPEAVKKIKSQMNPREKMKYADYTIDTSGSLESTVEQTERIYRNLLFDYEMKNKS